MTSANEIRVLPFHYKTLTRFPKQNDERTFLIDEEPNLSIHNNIESVQQFVEQDSPPAGSWISEEWRVTTYSARRDWLLPSDVKGTLRRRVEPLCVGRWCVLRST